MTESQKLYRIEELYTGGWEVVANRLPRETAKQKLDELLNEGTSPDRIRIIREQ